MEDRWFTQKEVNKIFDHIPTRTIRWWGLMGLYGWAFETPDGRGISREYDLGNLYQIGIVEELSSLNIPTPVIKQIMHSHFRTTHMRDPELDPETLTHVPTAMEFEKVLVISKSPKGAEPGKRERGGYGWVSSLVSPDDLLFIEENLPHTMILVNLKEIQKWVDSRIVAQT